MTDTVTLPRSVVEQALEALKIGHQSAQDCAETFHVEMAGYKQQRHEALDAEVKQISDAIGALRAALEQPQGEQEPVAWMHQCRKKPELVKLSFKKREPALAASGYKARPLIFGDTVQPRQPLTDAQINDHRLALPYDGEDMPDPWDFKQGVRAAERVHGIGGDA